MITKETRRAWLNWKGREFH